MSAVADVLVIGGGPAGTAAAIHAAQRGLSVVLVERSRFPRHRPGETLHPGVESILNQLGVRPEVECQAAIRHYGQTAVWAGRRSTTTFGEDEGGLWRGYQISRDRLDAILLERARKLGVEVLQSRAVSGKAILAGDRVFGVDCPGPIHSRFTVDATGVRGFLRRSLSLVQMDASPALRAFYGYGEGEADEAIPSIEGDERGWTWTAQIGRCRFVWTRLVLASAGPVTAPFLPNVRWLGPVRGADVTWRTVPACAGRGYFLAGDAAATLDPASSHGVLRALMSGMMAAHLCASVISGSVPEDEGAEYYRAWSSAWFSHDTRHLRELYESSGFSAAWHEAGRPWNAQLAPMASDPHPMVSQN